MKKLIVFCLAFAACDPVDLKTKAVEGIMAADKAMCKRAGEIGFNRALAEYACDGFVKLNNGGFPDEGKLAFVEKIAAMKPNTNVIWEPLDAEASKSGDLGYSWGNWKFVLPDTTYYGNYVTVWKKDTDGKWKMLLDGGNDTPKPMTEK